MFPLDSLAIAGSGGLTSYTDKKIAADICTRQLKKPFNVPSFSIQREIALHFMLASFYFAIANVSLIVISEEKAMTVVLSASASGASPV
ncbi:hypothetical protein ACW0KB_19060 [Virgibacillus salarius]